MKPRIDIFLFLASMRSLSANESKLLECYSKTDSLGTDWKDQCTTVCDMAHVIEVSHTMKRYVVILAII